MGRVEWNSCEQRAGKAVDSQEARTPLSLLGRLRLSQGQHAQMGTCRPVEGVQCEEAEQWSS